MIARAALTGLALTLLVTGCGDDDRPRGDAGPPEGCGDWLPDLECAAPVTAACTGFSTSVSVPMPTVDETCGAAAGTITSDAPADGFAAGSTTVTFSVPAESGGTASCETTVTVTDSTPPSITCPTDAVIVRTAPDEVVTPPAAEATDTCDDSPTIVTTPTELDRGTTPVSYTATDTAGGESSCTTDVTVLDAFAPEGFRIISAQIRGDGSTDVTLAWDGSAGADVSGYAVERGPSADGPWERLESLGAGARTWTDATLEDDRAHYRVVALADVYDGGATRALEAFSIEATGYDLRGRSVPTVPFSTTLYGVVRHPVDVAGGPYPLVLMIHGNHGNCRRSLLDDRDVCGDSEDHECPFSGWVTTPNAEGMAYLAESIAAQGYVAVSISANALNCRDDYILERSQLVIEHLRRWLAWNTIGGAPFGDSLVGAVDLSRVGLVGHSRGGEAVAHVPGLLASSPIGGIALASVFSIAPTDYHDPQVVDVPYAVLLPGCDGDVWTLEGMHIYDRSVEEGDGRIQSQVLFAGANHNFFNTEWKRDDNGDGRICDTRLEVGAPAQRGMLEGYLGSWLRSTVLDDGYEGFVRAETGVPEGIDAWADTSLDLRFSYTDASRMLIADFGSAGAPATNRLGESNDFDPDFYVARSCNRNDCDSRFDHYKDAMFLSWDGTGTPVATFGLGGLDASEWGYFSFRVVARWSSFNTGREVMDFHVALTDAGGGEANMLLSEVQRVPYLYPANAPHEILQTVRIPVSVLEDAGIDTSALESFVIRVPAPDHATGSFLLTDVELAN